MFCSNPECPGHTLHRFVCKFLADNPRLIETDGKVSRRNVNCTDGEVQVFRDTIKFREFIDSLKL